MTRNHFQIMKITIAGVVVFVVLVAAFFLWFGGPQKLPAGVRTPAKPRDQNWFYCAALFVVAAVTACFGDKEFGMFPPTSLRWLFIIVGALMMIVSALWMNSIQHTVYE
jgi:drug/metabolite transporter (DMT)-like permease